MISYDTILHSAGYRRARGGQDGSPAPGRGDIT